MTGLYRLWGGGPSSPPPDEVGGTLVIGNGVDLDRCAPWLDRLPQRWAPLVLGRPEGTATGTSRGPMAYTLPRAPRRLATWARRLAPMRVVLIGDSPALEALGSTLEAPVFWIQGPSTSESGELSRRPVRFRAAPGDAWHMEWIGDPTLPDWIEPAPPTEPILCDRFAELRERGQWILYGVDSGIGEEEQAMRLLFQLGRFGLGLLILGPAHASRYEPAYRSLIGYNLPITRHVRLITSRVPRKTRVYYVEEAAVRDPLFACADAVIAGGTLSPEAGVVPDLITPIVAGCPVWVGPARSDPMAAALVAEGGAPALDRVEALAEQLGPELQDAEASAARVRRQRDWLDAQRGAPERFLAWVDRVTGEATSGARR